MRRLQGLADPIHERRRSGQRWLRRELDLYANIRPARNRKGVSHPITRPMSTYMLIRCLVAFSPVDERAGNATVSAVSKGLQVPH